MKFNYLHPNALSAAMRGGTEAWGEWGNAQTHIRYSQPTKSRCRCHCGCKTKVTHVGMCNGVALTEGCEMKVMRWVRAAKEPKP